MSKTRKLKIALAQLNPIVGDLSGNAGLLKQTRAEAAASGADIVVASELFLTGYPPEDLVLKRSFLTRARRMVDDLVALTADGGPALIFGAPMIDGGQLHNSVIAADGGQMAVRHKHHLPNYAVFDEKRLFHAGPLPAPVEMRGVRIGVPICEDIWFSDVCAHLKAEGADLLVSPNGSPFERGKHEKRCAHARARAGETGLPLVYVNQFGGQDELVFDGGSFVMAGDGTIAVQGAIWSSDVIVTDWRAGEGAWVCTPQAVASVPDDSAQMYQAAMQGLRDYVNKNGFPGVLLGLSGGIDSAICAAMAVDALG
ncbi:MAG: nitrilase-related carbon-nitrogen hydrolase, partial [Pseudomonadota bacterium]|nr:nitrilase-related carbon-nitrogen hydrolase [Pseudomonadota bacterium]